MGRDFYKHVSLWNIKRGVRNATEEDCVDFRIKLEVLNNHHPLLLTGLATDIRFVHRDGIVPKREHFVDKHDDLIATLLVVLDQELTCPGVESLLIINISLLIIVDRI